MECILCKNQYVGKSETPYNFRINNHRRDVNNPKVIPACYHFKTLGHNFMKHVKFTLIEQLSETSSERNPKTMAKIARRFLDY